MFTGIVQGTGKVEKLEESENQSAVRMTVNLGRHSRGLKTGQSVALNGVCLTATKVSGTRCVFEMIGETMQKTDLGSLGPGDAVNLERSLRANQRLEGHFVLGHVDGVGTIKEIKDTPKEVQIVIRIPRELSRYVVKKGSIAVDGVSLTVTDIRGLLVSVSLIPHTISVTNFKTRRKGDKVNIETDILGKYALR